MLKLSGYMQGEPAVLFKMRMESEAVHMALFQSDQGWEFKSLDESDILTSNSESFLNHLKSQKTDFVLFEKKTGEDVRYHVREGNIF